MHGLLHTAGDDPASAQLQPVAVAPAEVEVLAAEESADRHAVITEAADDATAEEEQHTTDGLLLIASEDSPAHEPAQPEANAGDEEAAGSQAADSDVPDGGGHGAGAREHDDAAPNAGPDGVADQLQQMPALPLNDTDVAVRNVLSAAELTAVAETPAEVETPSGEVSQTDAVTDSGLVETPTQDDANAAGIPAEAAELGYATSAGDLSALCDVLGPSPRASADGGGVQGDTMVAALAGIEMDVPADQAGLAAEDCGSTPGSVKSEPDGPAGGSTGACAGAAAPAASELVSHDTAASGPSTARQREASGAVQVADNDAATLAAEHGFAADESDADAEAHEQHRKVTGCPLPPVASSTPTTTADTPPARHGSEQQPMSEESAAGFEPSGSAGLAIESQGRSAIHRRASGHLRHQSVC